MRTRRSPRHQDILWRALTPQALAQPAPEPARWHCRDCTYYHQDGPCSRGECTLRGDMVNGRTEGRPCFRERRDR